MAIYFVALPAHPRYYANEPTRVTIAMEENPPVPTDVERDYTVSVSVTLGPREVSYAVIRRDHAGKKTPH